MASTHIGNGDAGLRGFLHDSQLLVDGIPSTALNIRINLSTLCIQRHSRMTRLTRSSYLRQTCPVEIGASPEIKLRIPTLIASEFCRLGGPQKNIDFCRSISISNI
jgi:hypothetical protein